MALCVERDRVGPDLWAGAAGLRGPAPGEFRATDANCLEIGLINNMPDAALEARDRRAGARGQALWGVRVRAGDGAPADGRAAGAGADAALAVERSAGGGADGVRLSGADAVGGGGGGRVRAAGAEPVRLFPGASGV